jgi:hypothetical protein
MKKILSLLLVTILIFTLVLPINAFAVSLTDALGYLSPEEVASYEEAKDGYNIFLQGNKHIMVSKDYGEVEDDIHLVQIQRQYTTNEFPKYFRHGNFMFYGWKLIYVGNEILGYCPIGFAVDNNILTADRIADCYLGYEPEHYGVIPVGGVVKVCDFNKNQNIDIADVIVLLLRMIGSENPSYPSESGDFVTDSISYDYNYDGKVNINDAVAMLKKIVNLV